MIRVNKPALAVIIAALVGVVLLFQGLRLSPKKQAMQYDRVTFYVKKGSSVVVSVGERKGVCGDCNIPRLESTLRSSGWIAVEREDSLEARKHCHIRPLLAKERKIAERSVPPRYRVECVDGKYKTDTALSLEIAVVQFVGAFVDGERYSLRRRRHES